MDGEHREQGLQTRKIRRVRRDQRDIIGQSGRRDHEIGESAAGLSPGRDHGGVNAPVGPCLVDAEGKRIEHGLDALQPVLTAGTFDRVGSG